MAGATSAKKTILIIEDEPHIVMGLRDALEFEGFTVKSAGKGKDGVQLARAESPDAVILDLMLPDINGYAVCEELRRVSPFVPIIMLTARSQETDKIRGLDAGALGRLQLYAIALPRATPVNVNTAPAEVIAAVVEGLDLPQAQAFARRLAAQPVRTANEFQAGLRPGLVLNLNDISAASQFFVVQGRAQVGGADLRMQALLQRAGTGMPAILWQRMS